MFEPASGIILLLVVVLAGSVIAAACYAMFQSLRAIVTLVTGLLPGGSRGSLFLTVAETAISRLIIVFHRQFLSGLQAVSGSLISLRAASVSLNASVGLADLIAELEPFRSVCWCDLLGGEPVVLLTHIAAADRPGKVDHSGPARGSMLPGLEDSGQLGERHRRLGRLRR